MERQRRRRPIEEPKKENLPDKQYDVSQEPIVISKITSDILLKQKNPSDLMALYWFYYYTAKWQKSNNAKSTTSYTAKGLKWGEDKVRQVKKQLIQLELIEDIREKRGKNGKFGKCYIYVKFIWWDKDKINNFNKTHPCSLPESGINHSVADKEGNALSTGNLNALSTSKQDSLLHKDGVSSKHLTSINKIISFWNSLPRTQKHSIPETDEDKITKTYKIISLHIDNLLSGKPLVRNKDNSPSKPYKEFLAEYKIPSVLYTMTWIEKDIINMLQIFSDIQSDKSAKMSLSSVFWNNFAKIRGGGFSWFIHTAANTDLVD